MEMEIGKMYFITATILDWQPILLKKLRKQIIIRSLKYLVDKNFVRLHAFVIMPNHIHLIWKPLVTNVQLRFMKFTGQKIKFELLDYEPDQLEKFLVNKKDRTYQIWQRNPLATELYSRKVVEQKLDYIHNNPVQGKWMLAKSPLEYPFSSARFYEYGEDEFELLTHYMDEL